jgi:IMP dehydrogenase
VKKTLTYDDVLLVPQYSDIESRKEVVLSSRLSERPFIEPSLPIISSPMDTVTEVQMALAMERAGGLGIVHRYNTIEQQALLVKDLYSAGVENPAAAIGMTGHYQERAMALTSVGAKILCVDVAHGHHAMMERCLKTLKERFGHSVHIMAGNVATREGYEALAAWGADSVRCNIGGGSICSTRIQTGHGVPGLQTIFDCAASDYDIPIIADGGMRNSGDMVKALAAGADFVMVGSLLAGTDESPGLVVTNTSGEKYKIYRGMASRDAQSDWRGRMTSAPEGVSTTVPYKGGAELILQDLSMGIRSGLSYSGSRDITEFQARAKFVRQTNASQTESGTHILRRK